MKNDGCTIMVRLSFFVLKMSFAQRGYQFRLIGYRLIRNCRKIIFLTPKSHLPRVLEICRDITKYFAGRKSPTSKSHLDYMITRMESNLSSPEVVDGSEMKEWKEQFRQFHDSLEAAIEKEFPSLWG